MHILDLIKALNDSWDTIVAILAALGILTRFGFPLAKIKKARDEVKEALDTYRAAVAEGGPDGPNWTAEEKESFVRESGEALLAIDAAFGSWVVKVIRKLLGR